MFPDPQQPRSSAVPSLKHGCEETWFPHLLEQRRGGGADFFLTTSGVFRGSGAAKRLQQTAPVKNHV